VHAPIFHENAAQGRKAKAVRAKSAKKRKVSAQRKASKQEGFAVLCALTLRVGAFARVC
jgi:hypothetical protein